MMKNRLGSARTVVALTLFVVATLLIQGCAGATPTPEKIVETVEVEVVQTKEVEVVQTVEVEVVQTKEVEVPVGCADPPINFGFQCAFTGDWSQYGLSAREGVDLAVKQLNDGGGVLGRCVELIYRDTGIGKERDSAAAAQEFCQNPDVNFVMGDFASSMSLAAMPLYDECGKILFSGSSSHPDLTAMHENFFRTLLPNPKEFTFTGGFYLDEFQPETVAIVHMQNDWGMNGAELFKEVAIEKGIEVVAEDSYLPELKDFSAIATALAAADPDVVLEVGYYSDAALFISAVRGLGVDVPIVGVSSLPNDELIEIAGEDAAEGVYATISFWPESPRPEAQEFMEAFTERYGRNPLTQDSATYYDAVMILADAIERAGTADDAEAVREALATTTDYPGVLGDLSYGPDREPDYGMTPVYVSGGEWKYFAGQ
jgi:branched-chain amino acid transport system substrate-binding protein